MTRKLTPEEQEIYDENKDEVFNFLADLRLSGQTNMFGAVPYILEFFALPVRIAKALLFGWMKSFKADDDR